MAELLAPRRKRWPLITGVVLGSFVVLYFLLTSGFFLRSVVLPQVSSAAGVVVEAGDISLSPFSSVEIRNLTVTAPGQESLAKVDLIRARYSLLSIIGGDIDVSEVTVENPVVTLVGKADGSMNLPKSSGKPSPDGPPVKGASAPRLNLRNIQVRNATFRANIAQTNGTQSAEITGLGITLDRLVSGAPGKLTITSKVASKLPDRSEFTGGIDGNFTLQLDDKLKPTLVNGSLVSQLATASGALKELAGLRAQLDVDVTATEVKQLRLGFQQAGQSFADIRLGGPVDFAKKEARISYSIGGIDRRLVRLAAPTLPYDLGKTMVSAEGRVDLGLGGNLVTSQGKLTVADLTLGTTNGTTPNLRVTVEYKGGMNLAEKTAVLDLLEIAGVQSGRNLVVGSLDRPMNLSWDRVSKGFRDSTFGLKLDGLQVSDWAALVGPSAPSAKVSATLGLRSDRDGRDLKASLEAKVEDASAKVGDRQVRGVGAVFGAEAVMLEFADLGISKMRLDVSQGGVGLLSLNGTMNHSLVQASSGAQFSLELDLARAAGILPVEGLAVSAGSLKASGAFSLKDGTTNVTTDVTIENFTGGLAGMEFRDYRATVGIAVDASGGSMSIQRMGLTAQSGFAAGGTLDVAGRVDLIRGGGEIDFKIVNLNEGALAPFLAPGLKPGRLRSVALDGSGKLLLAPGFDAEITSEIRMGKLVVEGADGRFPAEPLQLGLGLEGGRKGGVIELKSVRLDLGKTTNALNQLTLAGSIDLSPSNAAPSRLTIRSDGLDLTPLYNILAVGGSTGAPPAKAAADTAAKAPATPPTEPAAVVLPFKRFDVDLDIRRVVLGEIDVTGWKTGLAIKDGTVSLDPFQLQLNGSPVTAKALADLTVPGYRYDVGFKAEPIPLGPILNTLQPARRGMVGGTVLAEANVKGAGVTGASLAKNLSGAVSFSATNLNLSLDNVTSPLLKSVINVVTAIPALIKNPTGKLGDMLGRALGRATTGSDPWADELHARPLDSVVVAADLGNGGVRIKTARIQSAAFLADASGGLRFAPVLDNSTLDIPVDIALQRSLAEKAVLLDASVPAGTPYAPLPRFLTLKGTLGTIQPDINYTAVAAMSAKTLGRAVGGLGGNVGNKVGGVLGALGNAFGGNNAAAATNSPVKSTNAPANPVGDLLRSLGRPKN
jgi:hypothetical protein